MDFCAFQPVSLLCLGVPPRTRRRRTLSNAALPERVLTRCGHFVVWCINEDHLKANNRKLGATQSIAADGRPFKRMEKGQQAPEYFGFGCCRTAGPRPHEIVDLDRGNVCQATSQSGPAAGCQLLSVLSCRRRHRVEAHHRRRSLRLCGALPPRFDGKRRGLSTTGCIVREVTTITQRTRRPLRNGETG